MSAAIFGTDVPSTVYVGNLDERVSEELLWELFLQAGALNQITMPPDPHTGKHRGYAFVEFKHSVSGPYAIQLLNDVPLFNRCMRVRTPTRQAPHSASTTSPMPAAALLLNRTSSTPGADVSYPARGFSHYNGAFCGTTPPSGYQHGYPTGPMAMSEPAYFHRTTSHDSSYGRYDPSSRDLHKSEPYHRSGSYGRQDSYHSHSLGASPDFRHQQYHHGSSYGHQWAP